MHKPFALALAFVLLSGFSYEGPKLPMPGNLIQAPIITQKEDFSCGDVAVLSVLRYYDFDKWQLVPEKALYKPMKTSSKAGTDPAPMAAFMNKNGLQATVRTGLGVKYEDITRHIDGGNPVIVAIQAWQAKDKVKDFADWTTDWADGHWVVVVGYDKNNVYFMDPSTARRYSYIPKANFLERWHDILGADNRHVQHISIFVKGARKAPTSRRTALKPLPDVARIN